SGEPHPAADLAGGCNLITVGRLDPSPSTIGWLRRPPGSETIAASATRSRGFASPGPYILLRTMGLAQPTGTEASGLVAAEAVSAADGGDQRSGRSSRSRSFE